MTAAQAIILIGGSFVLMSVMVAWMRRTTENERELMQRRHDEWVANGSNPDEKPNFYMGSGGGNTGGG